MVHFLGGGGNMIILFKKTKVGVVVIFKFLSIFVIHLIKLLCFHGNCGIATFSTSWD